MSTQSYQEIIIEGTKRFLEKYIQDSAFFVNRFLVGYNKDKLRVTLQNFGLSKAEISKQVNNTKSYEPITRDYIYDLYLFYEALVHQEPSEKEIIVYRGCDTLEDKAMDGLSATSLSLDIAKRFNYGTILKIHIPVQSQFIICSEFVRDEEEQIILPPCDYEIISEHMEVVSGRNTRMVEIKIKPRDILKDFSLAMQKPTQDYINENRITQDYRDAFQYLYQIMIRRALNCYSENLLKRALENQNDLAYPRNKIGIYSYSDILLIEFIIKMKDYEIDYITHQIRNEFYFVSPQEQSVLLNLITRYKEKLDKSSKKSRTKKGLISTVYSTD